MEIRVEVDDEFAKSLQHILGTKKATEIARAALTLLNWAADEVSRGRVIFSGDHDAKDLHKLAMPILDNVKIYRPLGRMGSYGTLTVGPVTRDSEES